MADASLAIASDPIERLQGVDSSLDDLTLGGKEWQAEVGDVFTDGTIKRTISGASTLTLNVRDVDRELLNSQLLAASFDVELDGLGFSFVAASMQGILSPLQLTFEDREVHRLRHLKGPKKAFRDKVTRAEFINRLRLDAAKGWGEIPFFAFELHQPQPIETAADGRKAKKTAKTNRGRGLHPGISLPVWNGGTASAAQVDLGDRILRVAESLHADYRVMVSIIATVMVETGMTNPSGGSGTSRGAFQVTSGHSVDPMDVEACAKEYLLSGFASPPGAIGYRKANPGASPGEIAQHCQASRFPGKYDQAAPDARKWVDAFLGGSTGGLTTVTTVERDAFAVKKAETYWDAIQRLAKEVHWRAFVSAGKLFYVTDDYLLRSMPRMQVAPRAPGIDDVSFDYDTGKKLSEITVMARTDQWSAPPGAVAIVNGCGPADGRYLVSDIEASLRRKDPVLADITLRRPTKPLPEPAPKTSTRTFGSGGVKGGSAGGTGGYVNPFPHGFTRSRIDQGVDFVNDRAGRKILAIGNAEIILTGAPGWPGGGGVVYKLLDGGYQGAYIYVYEAVRPLVHAGQKVNAGDPICEMQHTGYPWCEIGFCDASGVPISHQGYHENETAGGRRMAKLLDHVGAP